MKVDSPDGPCCVMGEMRRLDRAVTNLVTNALAYSPEDSVVRVSIVGSADEVTLHVIDQGPGIPDVDAALKDGFTTGKGMGLGLGGARRLSNEFSIYSKLGEGTKFIIARWK